MGITNVKDSKKVVSRTKKKTYYLKTDRRMAIINRSVSTTHERFAVLEVANNVFGGMVITDGGVNYYFHKLVKGKSHEIKPREISGVMIITVEVCKENTKNWTPYYLYYLSEFVY